jgi:hypothetical protein
LNFQKIFPILAVVALAGFVYWSFFGGPPPRDRSPQELAALRSVESIVRGQFKYKELYGEYADRLYKLGPSLSGAPAGREAAQLIPKDLAFGSERLGYKFAMRVYGDTFEISANPIGKREPPRASFYADQTGKIRENIGGQATPASPEVEN